MTDDKHRDIGLTKRELEREVQWMMRRLPANPHELARLLAQVVVTLIDKNNAAIAAALRAHDDDKPGV